MKKAFTLAEVLITLAIIGVVAAMTIPTLVQDYQKKVFETSFKNNRAKLIQVINLMKAQEGADNLSMMSFFRPCLGKEFSCEDINPDLRNYMKVSKFTKNIEYITLGGLPVSELSFTTGDCSQETSNCYQIADGAIITIYSSKTKPYSAGGEPYFSISIDTNGEKGPNQLGRDWFSFRVNNAGRLFGMGEAGMPLTMNDIVEGLSWSYTCNTNFSMTTKEFYISQGMSEEEFDAEWNQLSEEEKVQVDQEAQAQISQAKPNLEMGLGCAGRLIEKGKMDY